MTKNTPRFTVDELHGMAGATSFARGQKYYEEGRVADLVEAAGGFSACVKGGEPYKVRFRPVDGEVEYVCACPVGIEGAFCKHLVAACLAWLQRGEKAVEGARKNPYDAVREWLKSQNANTLSDLLYELALCDKSVFRQLSLKAARGTSMKNPAGLRALLDQAVAYKDFVPYEECTEYAHGILDVLDEFEGAIGKDAQGVTELCEYALNRVKRAIEHVDDSCGAMSRVIERIENLHFHACSAAKPDPKQLARKLFSLELASEYGEFHDVADSYAEILRKEGCAEFERLAREAWDKLPARKAPPPIDPNMTAREYHNMRRRAMRAPINPAEESQEENRRVLTRIMATLARRKGDFEALESVMSKDLSDASAFMDLVLLCRQHKNFAKALEWARAGVGAFKYERFTGIEMLLAEELRRANKHDEAVEIVWRHFSDRPSIASFECLEKYAEPVDPGRWRDKAVGFLRKTHSGQNNWQDMEARTLLIEIYLRENNTDMALAEADAGSCRWETLSRLARMCAEKQPVEALKIYTRLAPAILDSTINRTSTPNDRYAQAVENMLSAANIYRRLNRTPEFLAWHDTIRAKYKAKRNFVKLLDNAKWP